ncbi:MAG: hypothetical protein GY795_21700 [Desulfobacterales bacterium]|nr:hypothetical protein [Desulfobacterales bacterium]
MKFTIYTEAGSMRINFKQHELIDDLFQAVKTEFSEIELVNITRSPDDILSDYGYWISVIPDKKEGH